MEIIGRITRLQILRLIAHGAILNGEDLGDILLPLRYLASELKEGDFVEVFIYFDSEDRIVATTETPLVQRDEFAFLDVKEVNRVGAFMDWGLMKDLFIPFAEQKATIQADGNYLVYCYFDENSQRLVGSTKVEKFLDTIPPEYDRNQQVDLLVVEEHELGHRVIVDQRFSGMLYKSDTFSPIHVGQKTKGYVAKIREDEKIDVSLQPVGVERFANQQDPILNYLIEQGGCMRLTDKSTPEEVYNSLQMSKKTFKRAVGVLYKAGKIRIEEDKICLSKQAKR